MENEIKFVLVLLFFRREELRGEVLNMIRVVRFYFYIFVIIFVIYVGIKC